MSDLFPVKPRTDAARMRRRCLKVDAVGESTCGTCGAQFCPDFTDQPGRYVRPAVARERCRTCPACRGRER